MITLIHNVSCSKSQCLYQYLVAQKIPFAIRDYIANPLSAQELKEVLRQLALPAANIIRATDLAATIAPTAPTSTQQLLPDPTDEKAVISLLVEHPQLLQRPILIDPAQNRAVIGRPFEAAVRFLQDISLI